MVILRYTLCINCSFVTLL